MFPYLIALIAQPVLAVSTINDIADHIWMQLCAVRVTLLQLSFVVGMCFLFAAMFKFKQHKDNPTQNPVGGPLMYVLIATLLMYIGNFELPLKQTLYGAEDSDDADNPAGFCPQTA